MTILKYLSLDVKKNPAYQSIDAFYETRPFGHQVTFFSSLNFVTLYAE